VRLVISAQEHYQNRKFFATIISRIVKVHDNPDEIIFSKFVCVVGADSLEQVAQI
jgi:hypothetical protein